MAAQEDFLELPGLSPFCSITCLNHFQPSVGPWSVSVSAGPEAPCTWGHDVFTFCIFIFITKAVKKYFVTYSSS